MKHVMRNLGILATLLLLSASAVCAQGQANSTQTSSAQTVEIAERALREVAVSREHIANLERENQLLTQKSELLQKLFDLSQTQNTELRDALAAERRASFARDQLNEKQDKRIAKLEERGRCNALCKVKNVMSVIGLAATIYTVTR